MYGVREAWDMSVIFPDGKIQANKDGKGQNLGEKRKLIKVLTSPCPCRHNRLTTCLSVILCLCYNYISATTTVFCVFCSCMNITC